MSTSDVIVVMGVSGSGKTSVGRAIAAETGWDFVEGDSFLTKHQRAAWESGNLGTAETDAWLTAVGGWIDQYEKSGRDAVVACTALTHHERDVLRRGRPHVRFCHVTGPATGGATDRLDADRAALEPLGRDEHGVTISIDGDVTTSAQRALSALGLDPGHS